MIQIATIGYTNSNRQIWPLCLFVNNFKMQFYIVLYLMFGLYLQTDAQFFGISSITTRVIGGSPTTIKKYPILAQLLLDSRGNEHYVQYCAGVILTARHILTTAHCLQYKNYTEPKSWKIRLGSTYRSRGGYVENLKRFIIHPNFDKSYYINDIGIAVTAHALKFNDNVRQATIPESYSEIMPDSFVTIVGWGPSRVGGEQSEHLLRGNVRIIDQKICRGRYNAIGAVIEESMLCAGKLDVGGLDGCYGDSGGPLIYNGFVVGLVSFGYACGHAYYPGVYTKISYFTDWILSSVSNPT